MPPDLFNLRRDGTNMRIIICPIIGYDKHKNNSWNRVEDGIFRCPPQAVIHSEGTKRVIQKIIHPNYSKRPENLSNHKN